MRDVKKKKLTSLVCLGEVNVGSKLQKLHESNKVDFLMMSFP